MDQLISILAQQLLPVMKGHETNWVQTIPNEYWFTYFRLYAPTEAYFDRSWPMYDIEEIK